MTLKLSDRQRCFIVSCDASDRAVGFVLEQIDVSGGRRPVAFGVHGLQPAVLSASYGHLSLLPKLSVCESFQCVGTDD